MTWAAFRDPADGGRAAQPQPSTLLASGSLMLARVKISATFLGDGLKSCVNAEMRKNCRTPGGAAHRPREFVALIKWVGSGK